jgi:hypothetical protein
VEVMESVVELEVGEIDGDDMVDPRIKLPPVERNLPTQGWTRVVVRTEYPCRAPHSQIVFLIKKGGTSESDYAVSSRDNHHTTLARHHEMSAFFPSRRN